MQRLGELRWHGIVCCVSAGLVLEVAQSWVSETCWTERQTKHSLLAAGTFHESCPFMIASSHCAQHYQRLGQSGCESIAGFTSYHQFEDIVDKAWNLIFRRRYTKLKNFFFSFNFAFSNCPIMRKIMPPLPCKKNPSATVLICIKKISK